LIHNQCITILASVPFHIKFESLLGNILPACEGLAAEIALAGQASHGEVTEHRKDIEDGGLADAVPADDQLLGGRLEFEVYEAAIIGRVQSREHMCLISISRSWLCATLAALRAADPRAGLALPATSITFPFVDRLSCSPV
jgi:hypothetical protein